MHWLHIIFVVSLVLVPLVKRHFDGEPQEFLNMNDCCKNGRGSGLMNVFTDIKSEFFGEMANHKNVYPWRNCRVRSVGGHVA